MKTFSRIELCDVSGAGNIKVTLGLCVKNSEATVKDAVDSILSQDFPHQSMELTVVEGYSKDNTLYKLKDALKNIDIKTKIYQEREGLGKARQIVVDNALGEYIIWVDADMILSSHFVTNQVDFMTENPKVGIAKGKYGTLKKGDHENLVETLENTEFLLNTMSNGEAASKSLGESGCTLGTSGCIYRTKAIRQVGGFDQNFKGAAEDTDAEYRIRAVGWSIHITQAVFYEKRRQTWRSLWKEYFWYGHGGKYLLKKNTRAINLYKFLPPVAMVLELLRIPAAYKLTKRKAVLLLPVHYIFKRIAWYVGFVKNSP
jgi:glycosyltransferase involved in cell wall biosynthesis